MQNPQTDSYAVAVVVVVVAVGTLMETETVQTAFVVAVGLGVVQTVDFVAVQMAFAVEVVQIVEMIQIAVAVAAAVVAAAYCLPGVRARQQSFLIQTKPLWNLWTSCLHQRLLCLGCYQSAKAKH